MKCNPFFVSLVLGLNFFIQPSFASIPHTQIPEIKAAGFHEGRTIPWQNIEVKQKLFLNHDLKMSDQLRLKKGSQFTVIEVTSLDMINVELYELSFTPCDGQTSKKSADMTLIDELYGVTLAPKCKLDVYVELVDFSRPSFFDLDSQRLNAK